MLYLLGSVALAGVGLVGCTLLLLERLVLSRLSGLAKAVNHVSSSQDLSVRLPVTGEDELSDLAHTINGMLRRSPEADSEQLEEKARYRAVVEQATDCIFLWDAQTKRLLEANTAFRDLLDYSLEAISQLTIYDIIAYSKDIIDNNIELLLTNKQFRIGEVLYRPRRFLRGRGSERERDFLRRPRDYLHCCPRHYRAQASRSRTASLGRTLQTFV